jgi:hypothetical protein
VELCKLAERGNYLHTLGSNELDVFLLKERDQKIEAAFWLERLEYNLLGKTTGESSIGSQQSIDVVVVTGKYDDEAAFISLLGKTVDQFVNRLLCKMPFAESISFIDKKNLDNTNCQQIERERRTLTNTFPSA